MENAKKENEKKVWTRVSLDVDWRADFHSECHSIQFDRPTEENPNPEFPVKVGEVLSTRRLPMSGEWGSLYAPIIVKAFDEAAKAGTYVNVGLLSPFTNWTKGDIARRGKELGINYSETWSCYKGGDKHCGKCGTCVERKEALAEAGIEDPTIYEA